MAPLQSITEEQKESHRHSEENRQISYDTAQQGQRKDAEQDKLSHRCSPFKTMIFPTEKDAAP